MSLTVHSLGTLIFQTPPLALLSSSLCANQQATLHKPNVNSFIKHTHTQGLILNFSSPKRFSFPSHQMIAASQRQAGNIRYVVINPPKVLFPCQGEQEKWVILLALNSQQGGNSWPSLDITAVTQEEFTAEDLFLIAFNYQWYIITTNMTQRPSETACSDSQQPDKLSNYLSIKLLLSVFGLLFMLKRGAEGWQFYSRALIVNVKRIPYIQ